MAFGKKKKAPAPVHDETCANDPMLDGDLRHWITLPDGMSPAEAIRTFESGATRDTDKDKPEFAGFLSTDVLREFGDYMHKHRFQKDGSMRASDNWKRGIPRKVYIESMFRHFMDVLSLHEYEFNESENIEFDTDLPADQLEALMALLFNVQGYAYELLKGR